MSIGDRIKQVRGSLTRGQFASKLKLDKSTIQRYENENNIPKGDVLQRIYEIFNINTHWLLIGEGEPYINKDLSRPSINEPEAPYNHRQPETSESKQDNGVNLSDLIKMTTAILESKTELEKRTVSLEKKIDELEKKLEKHQHDEPKRGVV